MGNKVALHNLGCKVNAYEIEAMQQLLEEAGYEIVPFEPGADIYVINTCTVTILCLAITGKEISWMHWQNMPRTNRATALT